LAWHKTYHEKVRGVLYHLFLIKETEGVLRLAVIFVHRRKDAHETQTTYALDYSIGSRYRRHCFFCRGAYALCTRGGMGRTIGDAIQANERNVIVCPLAWSWRKNRAIFLLPGLLAALIPLMCEHFSLLIPSLHSIVHNCPRHGQGRIARGQ
jgi:hypothetical protein